MSTEASDVHQDSKSTLSSLSIFSALFEGTDVGEGRERNAAGRFAVAVDVADGDWEVPQDARAAHGIEQATALGQRQVGVVVGHAGRVAKDVGRAGAPAEDDAGEPGHDQHARAGEEQRKPHWVVRIDLLPVRKDRLGAARAHMLARLVHHRLRHRPVCRQLPKVEVLKGIK